MATDEPVQNGSPHTAEEQEELAFGQVWKDAAKARRPTIGDQQEGRRKSSVQFHTGEAEETIRRESVTMAPRQSMSLAEKRKSSPPPPSNYHRGVSFDTFDNKEASTESFTLMYKHQNYANSSRSRTFLCGTDAKDYSEYALEWMIDELVDDGDEIVCLRVIEKEATVDIKPNLKYREEANRLLESVIRKNQTEDKEISIVMELAVGKVQEIFQQMIQIYEPSALVVGTRGRNLGGVQGLLPGSVSKYCLQHSPVPVIVVRPSSKRLRKKKKRQQETGRSLYSSMVEQAQTVGGRHLHDKSAAELASIQATQQEADAVAKAIGAPKRGILKAYGGPLTRVTSNKTDATSDEEQELPSERFALPIGYLATESAPRADLAMKSPSIAMLEEDWDDRTPPRARSPGPLSGHERHGSDAAVSDAEDDDHLSVAKIVEKRRPSTRETTPWLADILRDKPKRPSSPMYRSKSPGHGRSPSR